MRKEAVQQLNDLYQHSNSVSVSLKELNRKGLARERYLNEGARQLDFTEENRGNLTGTHGKGHE